MANLSRHFRTSSAYGGARRGRFRISSFKAMVAIFCVAVIMIVPLWYAEEKILPPRTTSAGLLRGSPTLVHHEVIPKDKSVEVDSHLANEIVEALGGFRSSTRSSPSTDPPPEGEGESTSEGDQNASSSIPNFEAEGQSGTAGGGGVDQHASGISPANGKGNAGGIGGWPLDKMSSQDAGAQDRETQASDGDDGDEDDDDENAGTRFEKEPGDETEGGHNLGGDSSSTPAIEGGGLVKRQQEQQRGEETTIGKEQESIAESDLARDGEVLLAGESHGDGEKEAENSTGDVEQKAGTESENTMASASEVEEPAHEQQAKEEEGDGHGDEVEGALTVEGSQLAEDLEQKEEMEGIGPAASSSLAVDGEALLGEQIQEAGGGERGDKNGHLEEGAEEEEEGDVERRRRELNALVAASVSRVEEQKCNIAFVKTHKTASTTLTAVLYRYGLRHGRRVARFDVEGTAVTLDHSAQQTKDRRQRVDIFHYHHVWDGFFQGTWDYAREKFGEIMADPDNITYVTAIREPLEHWLSYYYFYYQPEIKLDVAEYIAQGWAKRRPLMNPLAAEFGIYTQEDLDDFIKRHLPTFALTVRTDELDEGLVLLSRIVSWDPIDLTYASMLTNHEGAVRWDKKPLKRAPDPADLDVDTISALKEMTMLDAGLYAAAMKHYAKVKERHSEGLTQAVEEFRMLQEEVLNYLEGPEGEESPAREWYMPESDYYFYSADKDLWWQRDYPDPLPF